MAAPPCSAHLPFLLGLFQPMATAPMTPKDTPALSTDVRVSELGKGTAGSPKDPHNHNYPQLS